jgi:hypothetical protein
MLFLWLENRVLANEKEILERNSRYRGAYKLEERGIHGGFSQKVRASGSKKRPPRGESSGWAPEASMGSRALQEKAPRHSRGFFKSS